MIDRDLTELYGVETRVLNQAVKRNIERFTDDFRFELSREECLRSQIVISNGRGGNRYSTYAFTGSTADSNSSRLSSAQTLFRISVCMVSLIPEFFMIPQSFSAPGGLIPVLFPLHRFQKVHCSIDPVRSSAAFLNSIYTNVYNM